MNALKLFLALLVVLLPIGGSLPMSLSAAPDLPYTAVSLSWEPNCGITLVKVYVREAAGSFINGIRARIESAAGGWSAISVPTGADGRDPGWTDFTLRHGPVAENWNIWLVDDAEGPLAAPFRITTDDLDCQSGGSGHQVATVQFVKGATVAPPAPSQGAPVTTPTSSQYTFSGVAWEPNCGLTQARLSVLDAEVRPVNGVLFHIETEDGTWSATSFPTGQEGYQAGWTDFYLKGEPEAAVWKLWVVDSAGNRLSDVAWFATDTADCVPGGPGHQVATIQFLKAATAATAPTPTPAAVFPYGGSGLTWQASCDRTMVNIRAVDARGAPIDGLRFHIEIDGGSWGVDSYPTGSTGRGPGWTDIFISSEPFHGTWHLWAIDDAGNRLSSDFQFFTDTSDCGGAGQQIATVQFTRSS